MDSTKKKQLIDFFHIFFTGVYGMFVGAVVLGAIVYGKYINLSVDLLEEHTADSLIFDLRLLFALTIVSIILANLVAFMYKNLKIISFPKLSHYVYSK